MRVSVIIPAYNKGRWIGRALDSVVAQTYTDYEVIVVDDGSTNDGPNVVTNYGDPRFRLMRQLNAGPGSARNHGLAEAKGELVAFLDADDEWFPCHLEDSVYFIDNLGPEVTSISSGYVDCPSGVSQQPMWQRRGIKESVIQTK